MPEKRSKKHRRQQSPRFEPTDNDERFDDREDEHILHCDSSSTQCSNRPNIHRIDRIDKLDEEASRSRVRLIIYGGIICTLTLVALLLVAPDTVSGMVANLTPDKTPTPRKKQRTVLRRRQIPSPPPASPPSVPFFPSAHVGGAFLLWPPPPPSIPSPPVGPSPPPHLKLAASRPSSPRTKLLPRQNASKATNTSVQPCGAGIALVHVGKAGGSSIVAQMRKGCHAWWAERYGGGHCPNEDRFMPNESELSKKVVAYWHVHTVPVERYTSFVVMVRNPIERAISIFLMGHPGAALYDNRSKYLNSAGLQYRILQWSNLFYSCFPTANAFAEGLPGAPLSKRSGLLEKSVAVTSSSCAKLGWKTLQGKDPRSGHFYMNYRFYAQPILDWNAGRRQANRNGNAIGTNSSDCPTKAIYVLRTEEIWHDMQIVNEQLGGGKTGYKNQTHLREGAQTSKLAHEGLYNRSVSRLGLQSLCWALREETAVYKKLLHLAVNLEDRDRETDYGRVESQCHI